MKNYIKGNYRRTIYSSLSGYTVGLFKIRETNDPELEEFVNKTVTFTGFFHELNSDDTYLFYGKTSNHERYGFQYEVKEYERVKPEGKEGLIEFLSSDLFSGIGEKIASTIVNALGDDTLKIIKNDYEKLLDIKGMTKRKALNLRDTIIKYEESEDTIIYLCDLGFTTKEALSIYKKYESKTMNLVNNNVYDLIDVGLSFAKIDDLRSKLDISDNDKRRVKACIIYGINDVCFRNGDTYVNLIEIVKYLVDVCKVEIDNELFDYYVNELVSEKKLVVIDDKYYLRNYFEAENNISMMISHFSNKTPLKIDLSKYIDQLEKDNDITYNEDQKKAINKAIKNNMLIITGGPGTGKTTIIKAIVALYQKINKLEYDELCNDIALIAPTGRASKRMSESTMLPSSTIHRFLKWNRESDSFSVNEYNKSEAKFVIIDEVSMIDTLLLSNLIKGLRSDVKLLMVGDYNQLPSVGPGQVLKDLIESECVDVISLNLLYRQDSNSYIPLLANEIKDNCVSMLEDKADFSFIETNNDSVKNSIVQICTKALEKGYCDKDIQVLCPMYKGENGIDMINSSLQEVFNPYDISKKEYKSGSVIYREGDKVLQLVNFPDENIFNGDIGVIKYIKGAHETSSNKIEIHIDFDGNCIKYFVKDLINITHAYAVSIHKGQGSEFKIVVMPIVNSYSRMLYKKLIYTGITRAKSSLILVGSKNVFKYGIAINDEGIRKTSLKEFIKRDNNML